MPFKSLKNHIATLLQVLYQMQISNFLNSGSAKDSGKVAAQLLKKDHLIYQIVHHKKLEKTH